MRPLRAYQVLLVLSSCCVLCTRRNFKFEGPPAFGDITGTRSRNNYVWKHNDYSDGLPAFSHQHVNFFEDAPADKHHHRAEDEGRWLCLVAGFCTGFGGNQNQAYSSPLNIVYEWTQLEYDYSSEQARQSDINSGVFMPGNGAPIDVEIIYGANNHVKAFVAIPRFVTGIPVTLGTITNKKSAEGNPLVAPFPNWRWHQNSERCGRDRLVSVFRVQLDECGKLWVLDAGRIGDKFVCPPQILAFDVNTKEVLHQYTIPKDQYESRSIFVTPVVDVRDPGQCRDTFVYAADCQSYSIIVYDVKHDRSWRIINKLFYPFPTFGTYTIAGEQFELMDGVLGLSLHPLRSNRDRKLFFHALSSNTENWVYTSVLRNQTNFASDPNSVPEQFHMYSNTRPSQSAASAIDKNGVMYFGMIQENSIGCWNTETPYGSRNIHVITHDDRTLQFASGVKITNNKKGGQELWVVTSRLQKAFTGTLNPRETNFRILAGKTEDLTKGTKCAVPNSNRPSTGGFGGGFSGTAGGGYGGSGVSFGSSSSASSSASTGSFFPNARPAGHY